jgi:hypothetical protein
MTLRRHQRNFLGLKYRLYHGMLRAEREKVTPDPVEIHRIVTEIKRTELQARRLGMRVS